MQEPVITIRTHEGTYLSQSVRFEDVYPLRNTIKELQLQWGGIIYRVSIIDKPVFIINKIAQGHTTINFINPKIQLIRRHTKQIVPGASEEKITYLLGVQDDTQQLYIAITEDGRTWEWREQR